MNPSPILYTSPHGHSSHRHSPRHQANTHSPRLRPNKSSSGLDSPHVAFAHPQPSIVASSLAAGSQQREPAKPKYAEHGTQYSPPDWPPTDPRSSLRRQPRTDQTIQDAANLGVSTNMVPVVVDTPSTRVSQMGAEVETKGGEGAGAVAATAAAASGIASPSMRRRHADMSQSPIRTTSPSNNSITQDSRSKRARPATSQNTNKTIMPRNYAECDSRVLSGLISGMLMELIHFNDELPVNNNKLTRFHSRAPPNISVHDYLLRLTHHATLIPPILLAMVFYIDKLCLLYPEFTINSLTVHRFLITAGTVASKGLSDSFWTNNTYARVGGVTVKELALLELEFLERMNWRIVPWQNKILQDYYKNLVQRDPAYDFEERKPGEESSDDEDEDDSMSSHSSDALVEDDELVPPQPRDAEAMEE